MVGYLVVTSTLIAVTIAAATLTSERLYFAATVNLSAAAAFLVYDLVCRSEVARTAFQYGAAAVTAIFFVACLAFYQGTYGQFLQRVKMIEAQKAVGTENIVLQAYDFEWWPDKYFMRDEGFKRDPKFHRNRWAAKYFGVKSIRLVE